MCRTRSAATDPVTSVEFQPIRCAIMLCHFGQKRNSYVTTQSILLSGTTDSSATSGYVVVPECFVQNEELAGSNEERTMKEFGLSFRSGHNRCNSFSKHVIMIF